MQTRIVSSEIEFLKLADEFADKGFMLAAISNAGLEPGFKRVTFIDRSYLKKD